MVESQMMSDGNDPHSSMIAAFRNAATVQLNKALFDRFLDNLFHNWGIAIAILLGSTATMLPDTWILIKVCSGLSTAIFSIERALEFGARWAFHRRTSISYHNVILMLDIAQSIKDDNKRSQMFKEAFELFMKTTQLDEQIPGATTSGLAMPSE